MPVFYGSQASQSVDATKSKVPLIADSMWASDASHYSDIAFSILRTAKYWDPEQHPEVEIDGKWYENTQKTMIVTVLKQRYAEGFGRAGVLFTPQTLEMANMVSFDPNDLTKAWMPKQTEMFDDSDI